jgi:hypothetical protein
MVDKKTATRVAMLESGRTPWFKELNASHDHVPFPVSQLRSRRYTERDPTADFLFGCPAV